MSSFAQNQHSCRMMLFLQHFGDVSDNQAPCGLCDFCLPLGTLSKAFRPTTTREQEIMWALLKILDAQGRPMSVSKVYSQLESDGVLSDRRVFDHCADALMRQGAIQSRNDSFEKDGKTIGYRSLVLKVSLMEEPNWEDVLILEGATEEKKYLPRKGASKGKTPAKTAGSRAPRKGASAEKSPKVRESAPIADMDDPLAQKLRGWRLRTAKKEKMPAYRIFTDRTLSALIEERPGDREALKHIDGIGPVKFEKYADELLRLMQD